MYGWLTKSMLAMAAASGAVLVATPRPAEADNVCGCLCGWIGPDLVTAECHDNWFQSQCDCEFGGGLTCAVMCWGC